MTEKFSLSKQLSAVNLARDIHMKQRPKNQAEHDYQRARLQDAADTLGWLMANEDEIKNWLKQRSASASGPAQIIAMK